MKAYEKDIQGIHVEWRYMNSTTWHEMNYPLSDYAQFRDVDDMLLNPHQIPGMYYDYDVIKVVEIFLGTYIWKMLW